MVGRQYDYDNVSSNNPHARYSNDHSNVDGCDNGSGDYKKENDNQNDYFGDDN